MTPPSTPRRRRDAPRRAVRVLRERLQTSRRWLAATSAVAIAAVAALAFLLLRPEPSPSPVLLGKGKAGLKTPVADTARVAQAPAETSDAEDAVVGSGEASYYGDEFAGRPTASGELFEPTRLTAAHRSLPLGSRVRVTNMQTDESVIVRVNDRGPFAKNRVIDVSRGAAREIGMLQSGTARVRLELVRS